MSGLTADDSATAGLPASLEDLLTKLYRASQGCDRLQGHEKRMAAAGTRTDTGIQNSHVAAVGRSEAWRCHAALKATHPLTQPWLCGQQQQLLPKVSSAHQQEV